MGIPSKDIEALIKARGMTFGEVIKELSTLSLNVKSLNDSVKRFEWIVVTIVGFGIAVRAIITAFIK